MDRIFVSLKRKATECFILFICCFFFQSRITSVFLSCFDLNCVVHLWFEQYHGTLYRVVIKNYLLNSDQCRLWPACSSAITDRDGLHWSQTKILFNLVFQKKHNATYFEDQEFIIHNIYLDTTISGFTVYWFYVETY